MPRSCAKMKKIPFQVLCIHMHLSSNSKYKAVSFIEHFFTFFQALRQRIAAKRKIHISNDVATAKKIWLKAEFRTFLTPLVVCSLTS